MQENTVDVAVKDRTGKYMDFSIGKDLMTNLFPNTRKMNDDEKEQYLLQRVPIKMKLTVLGSIVSEIELTDDHGIANEMELVL